VLLYIFYACKRGKKHDKSSLKEDNPDFDEFLKKK
jgi:hypothetical protein